MTPSVKSIRIPVALHATLGKYRPDPATRAPFSMGFDAEATVADLVQALGMPADRPMLIVMNGKKVERDTPLEDGQLVDMFPPVSGG